MLRSSKQTLSFRFSNQILYTCEPHAPPISPSSILDHFVNSLWLVPLITTLLTVHTLLLYSPFLWSPDILLCALFISTSSLCLLYVSCFHFFLPKERDWLDLERIITAAHQESKHHSPTNSHHVVDSLFIHCHSRPVSTQLLLMPDY